VRARAAAAPDVGVAAEVGWGARAVEVVVVARGAVVEVGAGADVPVVEGTEGAVVLVVVEEPAPWLVADLVTFNPDPACLPLGA
jgi:hypothetical protein